MMSLFQMQYGLSLLSHAVSKHHAISQLFLPSSLTPETVVSILATFPTPSPSPPYAFARASQRMEWGFVGAVRCRFRMGKEDKGERQAHETQAVSRSVQSETE